MLKEIFQEVEVYEHNFYGCNYFRNIRLYKSLLREYKHKQR